MLRRMLYAGIVAGCAVGSSFAQAAPVFVQPTGGLVVRKAHETKFFLGLQWNFGDSQPELVFGARRTETSASNQVRGGKIDLAIPLKAKIEEIKPAVRILGLAGNRDVQGEFGLGFRADWKPLVAVGAQIPYANAGVNYVFGDGLKPYAGLNSIRRAAAPRRSGSGLSCPQGYDLTDLNGTTYQVPDALIVDGKACIIGGF